MLDLLRLGQESLLRGFGLRGEVDIETERFEPADEGIATMVLVELIEVNAAALIRVLEATRAGCEVLRAGKPRVIKRAKGATRWRMEPSFPRQLDTDRGIVVLRLSGGYSPEPSPILMDPPLPSGADRSPAPPEISAEATDCDGSHLVYRPVRSFPGSAEKA